MESFILRVFFYLKLQLDILLTLLLWEYFLANDYIVRRIGVSYITGILTRLIQHLPLVEQELFTLLEHQRSPTVYYWVRAAQSFCVVFCRSQFAVRLL